MSVSTYALVHALHEFKIGDGSCFLSFARWDQNTGMLGRPHETCEPFAAEDEDPRVRQHEELFDNWLRRADKADHALGRSS